MTLDGGYTLMLWWLYNLNRKDKKMSKKDDDRRAYEERAAKIRAEAAKGKSIMQIMADKHAEAQRKLMEKAIKQDKKDKR
jgi:cytochrome c-type biogenesis protein CcmH/NrfG